MLGRIRGKAKDDDEAMEALRRRTAARLAAIVGISADEQPEDDLGPHNGVADADASDREVIELAAGDAADDDAARGDEASPVLALTVPIVPFDFFAPEPEEAAPEVDDAEAELAAEADAEIAEAVAQAEAVAVAPEAPADVAVAADIEVAAEPDADAAIEAPAAGVEAIDEDAPLAAFAEPERLAASAPVTLPERVVPVMAEPELPSKAPAPKKGRRAAEPVRATAQPSAPPKPVAVTTPAPAKDAVPSKSVAPARAAAPAKSATPAKAKSRRRKGPIALPAACPSCGALLEEVPTTARRCAECRQRIVVRRIDGRVVLVAEAVAPFFDAQRSRLVSGERIKREAGRWLQMAALAGAAPEVLEARATKVAARPTPDAITSARALYATTVERACRAARKARDWKGLADLRFRQAKAYYRASGAQAPADPAVLALHAEAIDASLRHIAEMTREAELVGGTCCEACRSATGAVVRITAERKAPTLPHADCPVGLCGCRWDIPVKVRQAKGPARRTASAVGAGSTRSRD